MDLELKDATESTDRASKELSDELRNWVEDIADHDFKDRDNWLHECENGVALCKLAMALDPSLKLKFAKKPMHYWGKRDNVLLFLDNYARKKVDIIFEAADLLEQEDTTSRNLKMVTNCLRAIAEYEHDAHQVALPGTQTRRKKADDATPAPVAVASPKKGEPAAFDGSMRRGSFSTRDGSPRRDRLNSTRMSSFAPESEKSPKSKAEEFRLTDEELAAKASEAVEAAKQRAKEEARKQRREDGEDIALTEEEEKEIAVAERAAEAKAAREEELQMAREAAEAVEQQRAEEEAARVAEAAEQREAEEAAAAAAKQAEKDEQEAAAQKVSTEASAKSLEETAKAAREKVKKEVAEKKKKEKESAARVAAKAAAEKAKKEAEARKEAARVAEEQAQAEREAEEQAKAEKEAEERERKEARKKEKEAAREAKAAAAAAEAEAEAAAAAAAEEAAGEGGAYDEDEDEASYHTSGTAAVSNKGSFRSHGGRSAGAGGSFRSAGGASGGYRDGHLEDSLNDPMSPPNEETVVNNEDIMMPRPGIMVASVDNQQKDELDRALEDALAATSGELGDLAVVRLDKGQYLLLPQKKVFHMKIIGGQLSVRVGGGYQPFDQWIGKATKLASKKHSAPITRLDHHVEALADAYKSGKPLPLYSHGDTSFGTRVCLSPITLATPLSTPPPPHTHTHTRRKARS